jgi:SEC-C motif-containing protein
MRSRYSAYALALVGYIVKTTHPDNPFREPDLRQWRKQLQAYCARTDYVGLKILAETMDGEVATVTFRAMILDRGVDASFTEKSAFERVKGRWLYLDRLL